MKNQKVKQNASNRGTRKSYNYGIQVDELEHHMYPHMHLDFKIGFALF